MLTHILRFIYLDKNSVDFNFTEAPWNQLN